MIRRITEWRGGGEVRAQLIWWHGRGPWWTDPPGAPSARGVWADVRLYEDERDAVGDDCGQFYLWLGSSWAAAYREMHRRGYIPTDPEQAQVWAQVVQMYNRCEAVA